MLWCYDLDDPLREVISWWPEHDEVKLKTRFYLEAAARLVFLAWLQQAVTGRGIIDREYGVGRGRIDLLNRWLLPAPFA